MLNDRLGSDRQNPKPTCKDRSTFDFCISNVNFIQHINDSCIQEFSSLYSDSHCGATLTVGSVYQSSSQAENMPTFPTPRLKLWKQENADLFLANFYSQKCHNKRSDKQPCTKKPRTFRNRTSMVSLVI